MTDEIDFGDLNNPLVLKKLSEELDKTPQDKNIFNNLSPEYKEPADEGLKFDDDKCRIDLVPPELVFSVATILTFGAKKYSERNWEKGMKWSRVFGATMRHMWCWWAGKGPTTRSFVFGDLDEETGYSHLWHAGCCISFLIAYEERGTGTDDRSTL